MNNHWDSMRQNANFDNTDVKNLEHFENSSPKSDANSDVVEVIELLEDSDSEPVENLKPFEGFNTRPVANSDFVENFTLLGDSNLESFGSSDFVENMELFEDFTLEPVANIDAVQNLKLIVNSNPEPAANNTVLKNLEFFKILNPRPAANSDLVENFKLLEDSNSKPFANSDAAKNLELFEDSNSRPASTSTRSSSPAEITSPMYEEIDDFRNHFNEYVKGSVPYSLKVKVPKDIPKKTSNNKVSKRSIKNPKKKTTKVETKKLPFVDNTIINMVNASTVRVDYDKPTTSITKKDVVRHTSPPKLIWKVPPVPRKYNQDGKMYTISGHSEVKPKNPKLELQTQCSSTSRVVPKKSFQNLPEKIFNWK